MNSHQRKLKRLLDLTIVLLESRVPLSAKELRERLPDETYSYDISDAAFRRTFERDKRDLISIGVPIEVKKLIHADSTADHYYIDRPVYAERDLRFTPDELAALYLAVKRVHLPGAAKAFLKTGIPTHEELNTSEVDDSSKSLEESGLFVEVPFDSVVSYLGSAAAKRIAVEYRYRRGDGYESLRQVEPWSVSFARGYWYMVGWDRQRKAKRIYRMDRISGPIVDIGKSTHPVGQTLDLQAMKSWDFGDEEPVRVKVSVDAEIASWAIQTSQADSELRTDGSVVLTLKVRNKSAFRTFVLSMLDHAEVLEPQWLRDELVSWLKPLS